jgi:transcriptional regulator with XRE-family HTH domain
MKINAEKIINERKSKAWSQQHLADASDVSLRTIQRVENNGTGSLETIKALAACFSLGVDELFVAEAPQCKSYFKSKVALICSIMTALFAGMLFIAPVSVASDIKISAEQVQLSADGDCEIFSDNVEIFVPQGVPFEVSMENIWGTDIASAASGRVRIHLSDSIIVIDRAIIIKMEDGVKITTGYAEKRFVEV